MVLSLLVGLLTFHAGAGVLHSNVHPFTRNTMSILQDTRRITHTVDDALRVSQVGYRPVDAKRAIISGYEGSAKATIRRLPDGEVAFEGALSGSSIEPDSGDLLREVDFTSLRTPGEYVLDVEGRRSHPFRISPDVYNRALYLTMRSFYGQRCGTAVDLGPDFPEYRYKACHLSPAHFHASSGKQGEVDSSGGWHDAGDFGRYVVNSGITTATLLWAFELNRDKLHSFDLDIPESGGALPDMLAEIRWNLDWMLKMQDVDGGVWHKATTPNFPGMIMPEEDNATTLVIGSGKAPHKTTPSTADFAAVFAIAGRVYADYDAAYAARCVAAAQAAWEWLERTPDHCYQHNPEGIHTGGYGDKDARDERLWAAAELYRTTGDPRSHQYFLDHFKDWQPALRDGSPQSWPNVENMAFYSYALCAREDVDPSAQSSIRRDALAAADVIVARTQSHGYHIALLPRQYNWGSNSVVANYAMMLQIANRLAPKQAYVDAAADAVHYLCGRNTFNTSFITHVGSKWAMNPHHRPSAADGIDQPWPGLLVGGPNVHQGRRELEDDSLPPARCWVDSTESYTMNENAINWNAAIVFVLSDLME